MSRFAPLTFRVLLAAAALSGCTVVNGDGELASEDREVAAFGGVAVAGVVEAEVIGGAEVHAVRLTCDGNLLEYIDTRVEGGLLVITEQNRVVLRPTDRCLAEVSATSVELLDSSGEGGIFARNVGALAEAVTSGSGGIDVGGIDSDALTLDASGSGEIVASGQTGSLEAHSSGSGGIDARALDAVDARVRASGSGDISVNASGDLDARTSGSGDIHVYGSPASMDWDASGSGDVRLH